MHYFSLTVSEHNFRNCGRLVLLHNPLRPPKSPNVLWVVHHSNVDQTKPWFSHFIRRSNHCTRGKKDLDGVEDIETVPAALQRVYETHERVVLSHCHEYQNHRRGCWKTFWLSHTGSMHQVLQHLHQSWVSRSDINTQPFIFFSKCIQPNFCLEFLRMMWELSTTSCSNTGISQSSSFDTVPKLPKIRGKKMNLK